MSNEPEVQNINGLTDEQKAKVERAKRLLEILNEEPAMELMPFIRFTERSIRPDVRLEYKNDLGKDAPAGEAGEGERSNDQSSEPSDVGGSDSSSTN